jgi:signal transduction histidine kinase
MLSTDSLERQLVDGVPVSIYAFDLDARVTSVHLAAARFGDDGGQPSALNADEARGRPVWEAMHDRLSREQVEHGMRLLRTGRAPVVRWELNPALPDRRSLLAQMAPLHDDSHAVTGFVISTVDITSVERARDASIASGIALAHTIDLDRALQEAAHQLRQHVRPDVIVIALGDDEGASPKVAYENGADSDARAIERRFADAWHRALSDTGVHTMHRNNGVEFTVALHGSVGPLGVLTVVTDDMESPDRLADVQRFVAATAAQTAAAVERSQRIRRAGHRRRSEAIGEVAAGVANELRNPIFGISSAAQLLRFRAREDPVMEKNVGRILREVERLNRMVGTLLELGRPIALHVATHDPDAVWDDVLQTERGRLESRAIVLRRTRPDTPTALTMDAQQLAQAFRNILSNAVDAAPEATDINLDSFVMPNGNWRCRLTNGGPPIPADMLPRVFELFLSTKPGSTGVGLALAQRVVEEHDGTITIDSAESTGTIVSVTLPNTPRTASLT